MRSIVVSLVLVAVACGGDGAGGGTPITVGADLNIAPTNGVRCVDGYPIQINAQFPQPFNDSGFGSCALLNFLASVQAQGLGTGTAVSANIRVGPVTGPMRFVRVRQLASEGSNGTQCCTLQEYGRQFTPTANSVTTVDLNFHLAADTDITTGIIFGDAIALEVLAPDVPIPGFWTRNGGADITSADYIFLPSFSQQQVPAPSPTLISNVGFSGFVTSYNIQYVLDP